MASMNESLTSSLGFDDSNVPIMRSFIVLRRENFGGYIFNPYIPPEVRLDDIRFRIAALCDGSHSVNDIRTSIVEHLEHSYNYVNLIVNSALKQFNDQLALYWRTEKLDFARDFKLAKQSGQLMEKKVLSAPLFVIWEITSSCNLRCQHCLSDSGRPSPNELNTEEAKEVIDTLSMMKVFNINFSGGEPLMRPDIFEILEYASGKKIGIDLLTNGGLITEETISKLADTHIFNVQVSVDGVGETHDNFRGVKGSYDNAINAINLLRKENYNVSINSVVTKENLYEIPKIIDLAMNLGVNGYKTTFFMPTGRGKHKIDKLLLNPENAKEFTLMIAEKKKEVGDKIHIAIETEYPWLKTRAYEEHSLKFEREESAKAGCTAGSTSFYITSDGEITPCPFLRKITAGHLRKDSVTEIWKSSPIFNIFRNITRNDLKGKCHNCEFLGSHCMGGCRAAALATTGDLYAEDPMCWKHIT